MMPEIVRVNLTGKLSRPWVASMVIILELLRQLSVKGGVGKIFEHSGPDVKDLSLPERATITNMSAELGAITSLFPSDERTKFYMKEQGREKCWIPFSADDRAEYDEEITIDINELELFVAQPHSPDNVVKIKEIAGLKVDQVCVGSCTNSSYQVMSGIGTLLHDKVVAPHVSMTVTPGTKQVYEMMGQHGDLTNMIAAGVRILESACGPCVGMGQAPPSEGISIRLFNRNFKGRSGTVDANVYLCNPFFASAIALKGEVFDQNGSDIHFDLKPEVSTYFVNDNFLIAPPEDRNSVEVIRGLNINPIPINNPINDEIVAEIILKTSDNISTDDILPAGSDILPFRSNVPAISEFTYSRLDTTFAQRAKEAGASIIVGGNNLWTRFFTRACSDGSNVSWRQSSHYQELCQNSFGKPINRKY